MNQSNNSDLDFELLFLALIKILFFGITSGFDVSSLCLFALDLSWFLRVLSAILSEILFPTKSLVDFAAS